jgi:hypothetical protein
LGSLNLPHNAVVYIDANILIYGVERIAPHADLLQHAWPAFDHGLARAVGSELLIIELLVAPLKQANTQLIQAYEDILWSGRLTLAPISATVLRRAADTQRRHWIRGTAYFSLTTRVFDAFRD